MNLLLAGSFPLENLIDRDTLTAEQAAALDKFLPLLEAQDAGVLALLRDPQVLEALKSPAAIEELAMALAAAPTEPEVTEPEVTEPEVTEPTEPEVTEPEVTSEPEVKPPVIVDVPIVDPFPPAPPSNISGKSKLGGLSVNYFNSSQLLEGLITQVVSESQGITLEPAQAEQVAGVVVDALLDLGELQGFLPTRQLRQQIQGFLLSKRRSAFPKEAAHLDTENFGNAITPNFNDFIYSDFGKTANRKYLTSDGLHLYTRVPAKVAGVEFSLTGGEPVPGTEITSENSIPYTFRLEETLAATNLPAWPGLNAQLFSEVRLRYSFEGPMRDDGYASAEDGLRLLRTMGSSGQQKIILKYPAVVASITTLK